MFDCKYEYKTKSSGIKIRLPFFIPVYRPDYPFVLFSDEYYSYGLNAVMVNSFLLYRNPSLRKKFNEGYTLREHLGGFKGVLCTDSGAFQQLGGKKVELDPNEIVVFQNTIKTDVAAPLDLITPPTTSYEETEQRMIVSHHRIVNAKQISNYSDLSGIQQGGGFFSLRQKHIRQLAEVGFNYYGIGSMVPFFNKNHDLLFTCSVIKDARSVIGEGTPMHVYGAGDPLDMAFMYYAGANIFDSSSYAHYAYGGFYMTPFGAVKKPIECIKLGFECACPTCRRYGLNDIFYSKDSKTLLQQHNLFVLLETVKTLGKVDSEGKLDQYVSHVYDKHINNLDLFPSSKLATSWEDYLSGKINLDANVKNERKSFGNIKGNCGNMNNSLTTLEDEMISTMVNEIIQCYKIEAETARKYIINELSLPKNQNFRKKINEQSSSRKILRLSLYKSFYKSVKKSIYHYLRQYKTSDYDFEGLLARFIDCPKDESDYYLELLLKHHISTKERYDYREMVAHNIEMSIDDNTTVIDMGCGFNPLIFSPKFYRRIKQYIAIDIDVQAVEVVRTYAKKYNIDNLVAYSWDFSNGLDDLATLTGIERFDYAIVLKVIPVVMRSTHNHLETKNTALETLGNISANKMLATVCKESMTKHQSIQKREQAALLQFVNEYNWLIESNFDSGLEFGYWLRKEEDMR